MKHLPFRPGYPLLFGVVAASSLVINCGGDGDDPAGVGGSAAGIGGNGVATGGTTAGGSAGQSIGGSGVGGNGVPSGGATSGGVGGSSAGGTGGMTQGDSGGASNAGGATSDSGGSSSSSGGAGTGGAASCSMGHRVCDGTAPPRVKLTKIMDGGSPVFVTSPPKDSSRIFVVDVEGIISIVENGGAPVEAANISVERGFGEQGLLSMAFHPNFGDTENRVYLAFNQPGGDTRVMETTLTGNTIDTSNMTAIVEQIQPDKNHNGGQLQFGPDGFLYFGLGDGGNSCDEGHGNGFLGNGNPMADNRAVDLTDPLGSIIRIDVDNLTTFPAGNISTDNGQDGRILHWGVRNPWRFSFDRCTDDLYIGDVGQNQWEEIDVLPAGSSGTNFGWPGKEGTRDSSSSMCNAAPEPDISALDPVFEYTRGDGTSVTGGYVYRGAKIPGLQGRYLFADYSSNKIWTLTWDGTKMCDDSEVSDIIDYDGVLNGIASFGEDADGELYITSITGGSTGVYRIDPE